MTIPSFADFLSSLNLNSINYDIDKFSTTDLKSPTNAFTVEQYKMLCSTDITIALALLQQYHEWLEKQLRE